MPKLSGVALLSPHPDEPTEHQLIIRTTSHSPLPFNRVIEGVGESFRANPYLFAYTQIDPTLGPDHPQGLLRSITSEGKTLKIPEGTLAEQGTYFLHEQTLAYLENFNSEDDTGQLELIDQDSQTPSEFVPIEGVTEGFRINQHVVSFMLYDLSEDYGTLRVSNLYAHSPSIHLSIPYVRQYELLEDRIIYNAYTPESLSHQTRVSQLHAITLEGTPIEPFRVFHHADQFHLGAERIYCQSPSRLVRTDGTFLHTLDMNGQLLGGHLIERVLESTSIGHRIAYLKAPQGHFLQSNLFSELHITNENGHAIENFRPIPRVFTANGLKINSSMIAYTTTRDVFSDVSTLHFIDHEGNPIHSLPELSVIADHFVLF